MSLTIRKSDARGRGEHGWLDARYSFSFADYLDPGHVHFRRLRVINEDRIAPGAGFPTHGHQDMEILTYVLEGRLRHRDSTGGEGELGYGDVQSMSAGTGVEHSEFNGSPTEGLHLLQIWIFPDRKGHAPAYREAHFDAETKRGRLLAIATPDGRDGALQIHTDARVHASILAPGDPPLHYDLEPGRGAWIQVARGELVVGDATLSAGDGASSETPGRLALAPGSVETEFLLFDLG
jgi:redox-sensitive bicupin YhaK (pirin superfamily)